MDMQKEIEKRQRAKMRQITSRRIKIAQLNAEIERLQKELVNVVATVADQRLLVEIETELAAEEVELEEIEL